MKSDEASVTMFLTASFISLTAGLCVLLLLWLIWHGFGTRSGRQAWTRGGAQEPSPGTGASRVRHDDYVAGELEDDLRR